MILITGGRFQGKKEYAEKAYPEHCRRWRDAALVPWDELYEASSILHLEEGIRKLLADNEDPAEKTEELLDRNPEALICCAEVGCGVVPVEEELRRYRDAVGFACRRIASEADEVVRLVCGIAQRIK